MVKFVTCRIIAAIAVRKYHGVVSIYRTTVARYIFTARRYANAVYAIVHGPVSVCLLVTRR